MLEEIDVSHIGEERSDGGMSIIISNSLRFAV
jgi:hypothetical protein